MEKGLYEITENIAKIANVISSRAYIEKQLHYIIKIIYSQFEASATAIIVVDPKTEYLIIKASYGLSGTFQKKFKREFGIGNIGKMLLEEQAFVRNNIDKKSPEYKDIKLENDFNSVMCAPLFENEKVVGYLYCDRTSDAPFTEIEFNYFQAIAGLTSFALEKNNLITENRNLTTIDKDTNTYKFNAFLERLTREMDCAMYRKLPISIGLIDLDNYKEYSRVFGLEKSKKLLADIAHIVKSNIKRIDLVGRYGADEIIVSLVGLGKSNVEKVFNRIRSQVENFGRQHPVPHTTVSIGIVVLEGDDLCKEIKEIIKNLSTALYRAQVRGKNSVFVINV